MAPRSTDKPKISGFDRFFETLELDNIKLLKSSASRSPDFSLPAQVQMHADMDITEDQTERRWTVTCTYDIEGITNGTTESGLKLSMTYAATYTGEGSLDERARNVLKQNAQFATWPYMRLAVRTATADMGLPPLDMGLLKMKATPEPARQPEYEQTSPKDRPVRPQRTPKARTPHRTKDI